MTPFTLHQDVIVVECDESGNVREDRPYLYGCLTDAGPCSVTARFGDGAEWLFLLDSRSRAWRDSGRLRCVPACPRCESPILGEPVTAENGEEFCGGDCRDEAAGASYEARYQPGVAT